MTELDDDILTLFFDSALAATAPVFLTATGLYEGACESGTVTSHTSDLPWAHGIDVSPSALLASDLDNPDGSDCHLLCSYFCQFQNLNLSSV